jgi:hypothetical protein
MLGTSNQLEKDIGECPSTYQQLASKMLMDAAVLLCSSCALLFNVVMVLLPAEAGVSCIFASSNHSLYVDIYQHQFLFYVAVKT